MPWYNDMNPDDLNQFITNKQKATDIYNTTGSWDHADITPLSTANDALRQKYGITQDIGVDEAKGFVTAQQPQPNLSQMLSDPNYQPTAAPAPEATAAVPTQAPEPSWMQILRQAAADPSVGQKELYRVSQMLNRDPNYKQGTSWYSSVNAAMNGVSADDIINGTADTSKFGYVPGSTMPELPNIPDYTSKYQTDIDKLLSEIRNTQPFAYDKDTDPRYQAFLKSATRTADKSFKDNMGGMAAMSGGRSNSWAGSVASQARGNVMQQAEEASLQFEDTAYQRYLGDNAEKYKQINLVMGMDDRGYSKYRNGIADKWANYTAQFQQYAAAIDQRKQSINEALERTKYNRYVTNEDAITLGLAPGTPYFEVSQAAEQQKQWLERQAETVKAEKDKFESEKSWEIEVMKMKEQDQIEAEGRAEGYQIRGEQRAEAADVRSDARKLEAQKNYASYSAALQKKYATSQGGLTTAQQKAAESAIDSFDSLVNKKTFKDAEPEEKKDSIISEIADITSKVTRGALSKSQGEYILQGIMTSKEYTDYVGKPMEQAAQSNDQKTAASAFRDEEMQLNKK